MPDSPTARLGDMHTCPMVTPGVPPIPHVGGPILPPCFPTVMEGDQPDARILDLAQCVGPPDPIAQGSATVLVGGLPTARMLDPTSHGGVIMLGLPTVIVGGPVVAMGVSPGSTKPFILALQTALSQILPTPSGVEWLRQMAATGHKITFQQVIDDSGFCQQSGDLDKGGASSGSDSLIGWNPSRHILDPALPGTQGVPGAAVLLAVGLVAALENATGNMQGKEGGPTENSFRRDLGVESRPSGDGMDGPRAYTNRRAKNL
jgi:uncharacterized Zn-binding protein involved in type VI secretion